LDLKEVQTYLESDEGGKKWLQSVVDSKVTQGIKTWQDNNLAKLLADHAEKEISKRYPAETDEQKRLKALEQELASEKAARIREALRNKALSEANTKGLPTDLVDHFVGTDEETTLANLAKLEATWKAQLERTVEERFKAGGRTPAKPQTEPPGTFTREQIEKMTHAERVAKWPEISKALADGRVKME